MKAQVRRSINAVVFAILGPFLIVLDFINECVSDCRRNVPELWHALRYDYPEAVIEIWMGPERYAAAINAKRKAHMRPVSQEDQS